MNGNQKKLTGRNVLDQFKDRIDQLETNSQIVLDTLATNRADSERMKQLETCNNEMFEWQERTATKIQALESRVLKEETLSRNLQEQINKLNKKIADLEEICLRQMDSIGKMENKLANYASKIPVVNTRGK